MFVNIDKKKDIYQDKQYYKYNPGWHKEDSLWKAQLVSKILKQNNISVNNACEVGCGAGHVLINLHNILKLSYAVGYDISKDASVYWKEFGDDYLSDNVSFVLGDFIKLNNENYDLLMLLDVLEHLKDPVTYLERIKKYSKYFVFHFPLDLTVFSVLFDSKLLSVREKTGHIHYFTKKLAVSLLSEAGYDIIDAFYTHASINAPNRTLVTKLSSFPRRIFYSINNDFGAKLVGGETLMIIAK